MGDPKAQGHFARSVEFGSAVADPDHFLSDLYLPISDRTILSGNPANIERIRQRHGAGVRIISVSPRAVMAAIERRFRATFRDRAVRALMDHEPQFSASTVVTKGQSYAFLFAAQIIVASLFLAPLQMSVALSVAIGFLFLANGVFRALLFLVGAGFRPRVPQQLRDEELPGYSVLVPLYREANVVPALMRAGIR